MRDYSMTSPKFWTGATGKELRRLGRDHQVIGFYLFTCPSSNMIGLYYLPLPTLCHEVGHITQEGALKVLQSLSEGGFCRYDEASEHVFVVEMAAHQLGERLTRKDNRHKAVVKQLEQYRKIPFFNNFLARYTVPFDLADVVPNKGPPSPSKAPSEPHRSQDQDQDQEQDQEQEEERARAATPPEVPRETSGVIDMGTACTQLSAENAFASLLDAWRRDVPECNAEAFARWIVHCESRGKPLGSAQRLYQAKQLAGNGDLDAQLEVVDFCIGKPYYSLVPIADVRARLRGMSRNAPDTRTPAQVDAARLRKLMEDRPKSPWKVLREFRDAKPGETSEQYNAAMTQAFAQSQQRDIPSIAGTLAAAKKVVA